MTDTPIWSPENGAMLQELRLNANMDIGTLAQRNMVSRKQVIQLEEGGDSSFYSLEIKYHVGKKLLGFFGKLPIETEKQSSQLTAAGPSIVNELSSSIHEIKPSELHNSGETNLPLPSSSTQLKHQSSRFNFSFGLTALLIVCGVFWFYFESNNSSVKPVESQTTQPDQSSVTKDATPSVVEPPIDHATESMPVVAKPPEKKFSENEKTCMWKDAEITLQAPAPKKAAEYVYLIASKDVFVCVMDGNERVAKLTLQSGEDKSIYGAPPFKIQSANMAHLKIFFQGQGLTLPNAETQQIRLVEGALK
jgi:transcriptional regulator with XRE-family HTH domain